MIYQRDKAFTLIEVLVSFAILGTLLVALIQAQTGQASLVTFTQRYEKAQNHVRRELLTIFRNPQTVNVSVNEGEFEKNDPMAGYFWKKEIYEEPIFSIPMKKVVYTVSWIEGLRKRNYTALIYVP